MSRLTADLRYTFRTLRSAPAFAAIAIITLALGVGAATVIFSVVYNVLVDPLPYKAFNRSVVFSLHGVTSAGGWKGRGFFSIEELRAFRDQNRVFDDMIAATQPQSFLYDNGHSTRLFRGVYVTTNAFDYFGVPPAVGRTLVADDGRAGAAPVFCMNDRLWRREFGGDPSILGGTFLLNGEATTLVGIMPPRFDVYGADIWLAADTTFAGMMSPMARLKPGVTTEAAAADLDGIAHRLAADKELRNTPEQFAVAAQTFLDSLLGDFKQTLYGLVAAVLLLVVIACSNVANLMLGRATVREREMALRASLGASRGRLVHLLVVESLVLAAAVAGAGFALSYAGVRVVNALLPPGMIPSETVVRLSVPVLLASLVLAVLTTMACGLAPAVHLVTGQLQPALAGSGKGVLAGSRHSRLRAGLVVVEVALSMVLLIGAGLVMRSFFSLTRVDLGFDPHNILYVRPWFPGSYDTAEKKNAFTREAIQRLERIPGVAAAAESMLVPPLTHDWSDTIIPGKPHAERWETRFELCSDGYFRTIGLRLVRGALFSEADVAARRLVAVVNETFARRYFAGEEPIGRRVKFQVLDRPFLDAPHDAYFEIVGIIRDHKTWGGEWQIVPQAFLPYSVQGFSWRTLLARTAVDPSRLLANVRDTIWSIDPRVGISASGTIDGSLREFYRDPQFDVATLGAFAGIGLALVAIGVFSVMAYSVSLRTHEIGIRMALGARPADVLRMVLATGARLVAAGSVIGLIVSYGSSRVLASQLVGISHTDPWTFGSVAIVVVAVGLAACLLAARRAMLVDPMVVLRAE